MPIMFRGAALLLAASLSLPCLAADKGAGVYAGVDLGRASASNSRYEHDDLSVGLHAGYQFSKTLGAEIFRTSLSFIEFPFFFDNSDHYYPEDHYGIALTGAVPLDSRFSLTGRAGIGRTTMHTSTVRKSDYRETDPSIGAGVRFAFNPHWSMSADAMRLTKTKVTVISTGFRYQF
jgi:hypothetical protein